MDVSKRSGVATVLIVAVGVLFLPVGAAAAVSTWTLVGVTFDDGGVANGTFDFDPVTGDITNWNVTTSGGAVGTFPVFTYDGTISIAYSNMAWTDPRIYFNENLPGNRHLRFALSDELTDAGGTVSVLPTNESVECFNCSPYRLMTGGTLESPGAAVTAIPTLGSLALVLFMIGLAAAGFIRLRIFA